MQKQVFRYVLKSLDDIAEEKTTSTSESVLLSLPRGAEVLSAAYATRGVILHALIDLDEHETDDRLFLLVGNGETVPDDCSHVATIKLPNSPTTHVFEVWS